MRANARVISISGLVAGSARALAVAAFQRETGKTFAVVSQYDARSRVVGERSGVLVFRAVRKRDCTRKRYSFCPRRKQILTPVSRRTRKHSNDAHSHSGVCNNPRRSSFC